MYSISEIGLRLLGRKSWLGVFLAGLFLLGGLAGCHRAATNDQALAQKVQQRISQDPSLSSQPIHVSAQQGMIVLSGTASTEALRMAAETDANQAGAQRVLNEISVASAPPSVIARNNPPATALPAAKRKWGNGPAQQRAAHKTRQPLKRRKRIVAVAANPAPSLPPATAAAPVPAAAPAPAAPPQPVTVTLPAGTTLSVMLDKQLSSNENQSGQGFTAHLADPVVWQGQRVIPRDALISGIVLMAHSAGHYRGQSELRLVLNRVQYNGLSYTLRTSLWDHVTSAQGKTTAKVMGGGTVLGALIGAIAGGGKGAAIGAAIGAGAGAATQAARKAPEITLPAETRLQFTLAVPLTVQPGGTVLRP